ncbi:VWA domain-containing protein [Candidatus Poribacteria bacterium]|nr:VWA domain-containing protein [Candidatus Poribacteria bacterium]
MDLLKPYSLILLLFLIPPLVLLYILKLKLRKYVISSNLLWEQVMQDIKANTPFQRLRKNILLPLQIIFLVLTVLAVARPYFTGWEFSGNNNILIIDNSASMKARDKGQSRLQKARNSALEVISSFSDENKAAIITAGNPPRIVSGFSSDKDKLRDTILDIKPLDTTTDIKGAMGLASSLVGENQEVNIFIYSDNKAGISDKTISDNINLNFISFGNPDAQNVGIVSMALDHSHYYPSTSQIFIALQNFTDLKKENLILELYHDDELIYIQELNLSPQERRSLVIEDIVYNKGVIKARIDSNDDLILDNQAYYVIDNPEVIEVALVSRVNPFLEAAIKTSDLPINFTKIKPELYSTNRLSKNYDLVIFDSYVPSEIPDKHTIIVNPRRNLPFGEFVSASQSPKIINWDRFHPVMRFLDLSSLRTAENYNYTMPSWMMPLLESDTGVMIWAGRQSDRRVAVLTFPIYPVTSSDFSMLPDFPIFTANLIRWAVYGETSPSSTLKTGDLAEISLPEKHENQTIKVNKPDGSSVYIKPENNKLLFGETYTAGVYEFEGESFTKKVSVNLLDPAESDIRAKERVTTEQSQLASSTEKIAVRQEIWFFLILIALLILTVEWWLYHRRIMI